MYLNKEAFKNIVKSSPIVAIDLCILNEFNEILLGKRINPPAKNFFFVPGGRILKNETLFIATQRILNNELNYDIKEDDFNKLSLLGIFEHFYDENFCDNKLFSTHYIVLTYLLSLKYLITVKDENFEDQHEEYIWYKKNENKNFLIHPYCMEYIKKI